MPDEFFARTPSAPGHAGRLTGKRSGTSWRAVLGVTLLAFIGGAVLVGYLVWNGKVQIAPHAPLLPGTNQSATQPAIAPAGNLNLAAQDQRIAALEQRLARVDAQASAAESKTARAEALLIAAAARRSVDRGAALGYLADPLKAHFGTTQGSAVQTLLDASRNPVTLGQLATQLDAMAPQLIDAPVNESGWDRFRREVSGLFVIRREEAPAVRAEDRLDQARLLLRTGQAEAAAAQVARLPGTPVARAWIANARRYAAAQRALDAIEAAALVAPEGRLPIAGPAATAVPAQPAPPTAAPRR